ncbi:MAG: bifunctional hydroxymethylpyrimidine kinase/phosphomethylpyrimidine kinase [Verrucomicrobiota bacterium]
MKRPITWTIAGSDSGGGAGIQGDLKTMNAIGVHGCSVITAVTAQNTTGISRIEVLSEDMVSAQLSALEEDLPPVAVKLGMLGTAEIVRRVAAVLRKLKAFVTCDPVMVSTSGSSLLERDARDTFVAEMLPLVHLLTPNIPEAEAMVKKTIADQNDMVTAARELLKSGAKSVLLKGGHAGGAFSQDYWTDGREEWWFTSPRKKETHTHGAGCTLSAAIAACHAMGYSLLDAIVIGKAYVNQGLRRGGGIGRGRGPLAHGYWPSDPRDMPWMTRTSEEGRRCLTFSDCGPDPIGLYPLVDRLAWLKQLLPLGVKAIQLRVKDLAGPALEQEIRAAIRYAERLNVRLFINDEWRLALKHKAYGVHLGQEDLAFADLPALAAAKMRLGISARSYSEIARALAVRPSYISLGAVFPTPSKTVDYDPIRSEHFRQMRQLINVPVVAIGGISLERAPEVWAAGAEGMAVISDITHAADPAARVKSWLQFFEAHPALKR